uniref:G_PROTEIN_RECEP_F1_2 domain-containing protein n=1 Tax=Rhabditophanes sp. KR3021 TaxID=114890 RepID=A0AC35TQ42_9BILA
MDNTIYPTVVFVLGSLGVLANSITFLMITFFKPRNYDYTVKLIKWARLPELMIALISGPFLRVRIMYPIYGAACSKNTFLFLQNELAICIVILIALASAIYIIDFIMLAYLSRYNTFCRKKKVNYFNKFEAAGFIFWAIIVVIVAFGFVNNLWLRKELYYTVQPNVFPIIEPFHNSDFTIVVLNTNFSNTIMMVLLAQVLFKVIIIPFCVVVYYIPLELALKQCMNDARSQTADRIKRNLKYLRICVILPIILALAPIGLPFLLTFIPHIPDDVYIWIRDFAIIGPQLYCIISPIIQLYYVHKQTFMRRKTNKVKAIIVSQQLPTPNSPNHK